MSVLIISFCLFSLCKFVTVAKAWTFKWFLLLLSMTRPKKFFTNKIAVCSQWIFRSKTDDKFLTFVLVLLNSSSFKSAFLLLDNSLDILLFFLLSLHNKILKQKITYWSTGWAVAPVNDCTPSCPLVYPAVQLSWPSRVNTSSNQSSLREHL